MATIEEMKSLAMKHWEKWRPEETAELKAEGSFERNAMAAAQMAFEEQTMLLMQGYQPHEAEEVVLKTFILKPPE